MISFCGTSAQPEWRSKTMDFDLRLVSLPDIPKGGPKPDLESGEVLRAAFLLLEKEEVEFGRGNSTAIGVE